MNLKKKIAMISVDRIVNRELSKQLYDVFKDQVEVKQLYMDDIEKTMTIDTTDFDLIIGSCIELADKIKLIIKDKNLPIVAVRRTVNLNKLTEVISLNSGENVLLVNSWLSTAIETIDLLKKLGVDHVNFIPYYPGCDEKIVDIAVTPGGSHLVPMGVKKVIDIGIRVIDVSSIIEIFIKLNLSTDDLDLLTGKYSQEMVRLNKFNSESNKILKAMFEVTNDGIASFDVSGNMFYCNHKFSKLLGLTTDETLSLNILDLIDKNDIKMVLDSKEKFNEIIKINDIEILMNKVMLYQGNVLKGYVIGIQEVGFIRNLDKEVRKKLVNSGFVAKYTFDDLIGNSDQLIQKIKIAKKIAKSDLTVLIQGDDGTGKEIFAQAIHNESLRKNEPFVAANFAALSESLLESELFGYEAGTFTGANKTGKPGLFEQADKGTIFIDEIGDTSPKIQIGLLRVLQEKQIMRVGGSKIIPIDVRVIAATNQDLFKMIENGKFRKDLYYRLKVFHFNIPNLEQRKEDIGDISRYLLKSIGSEKYFSSKVLEMFQHYSWPGNVRELENLVYFADSIAEKKCITEHDLPEDFISGLKTYSTIEHQMENIYSNLKRKQSIEEYIAILELLRDQMKVELKIGRNKISELLETNNVYISNEQVRSRLKELESNNLVIVGNTKQGTRISKMGINFLKRYS